LLEKAREGKSIGAPKQTVRMHDLKLGKKKENTRKKRLQNKNDPKSGIHERKKRNRRTTNTTGVIWMMAGGNRSRAGFVKKGKDQNVLGIQAKLKRNRSVCSQVRHATGGQKNIATKRKGEIGSCYSKKKTRGWMGGRATDEARGVNLCL